MRCFGRTLACCILFVTQAYASECHPEAEGFAVGPAVLGLLCEAVHGTLSAVEWLRGTPPAPNNAYPPSDLNWAEICDKADAGDGYTQWYIGVDYRHGLGPFPRDNIMAYKWFSLATANGFPTAQTARDLIAKEMTAEEIEEGERRVREWAPGSCLREASALPS